MGETSPQLRVGDRERTAVDVRMQAAVGDGVLTLQEYDERAAVLWQARTRAELDGLVADLPPDVDATTPPAGPPAAGRSRRVVAVLSEDRFAGALAPGQDVHGYAVMGKAVVDLRREDLPDGLHVCVRSVMGEVEVQVPPGAVVHLSGLSLMGERKVSVAPAGGPTVHVDAWAVLGVVKVTVGDGSVVPRHRPAAAVPAPRPSSHAVPHARPVHRSRGHLSRALGRAKALVVPAAVLGAVVLAGPDNVSLFGSNVERVAPDDRNVQVSTLWGSTTVVVPDGSRVDPGGFLPFGSTTCQGECLTGDGPEVSVRAFGAFGSVTIVTERQHAAEQARDRAEEAAEERQERREERADED